MPEYRSAPDDIRRDDVKATSMMAKAAPARTAESATYQIRALERGLDLLEAFSPAKPELSVAELAAVTELPKPTIVRLLSVLLDRSFIERAVDGERYRLGVKTLEVGSIYLQSTSLEAEAKPIMQRLVASTNQTVNLGILDRFEVVHIQVVAPDRPVRFWADIGKREEAHVSGLGKVLLSGLDDAQFADYLRRPRIAKTANTLVSNDALQAAVINACEEGYAIDDEESSEGVRCIAAPIRNQSGAIVAAISISGARSEFRSGQLPGFIRLVKQAGRDISARLGYTLAERPTS